ncbi:ABC transporter permease [Staphylococcus massiliensis]|uniref:nickel transporter permease n=1 Tax=Staphylococcus massiliensis TaxID=555791 RepID=UPI001EDD67A5|nr:nickel transporter permease [Staphylococcus massiliensis]MCG3402332.1 ABC transporter permease [Staphylococcus massiliensis]
MLTKKVPFIFKLLASFLVIMIVLQFVASSQLAYQVNLSETLQGPSLSHWLGTDELGRDLFSRVIIGARFTLFVTIMTLCITVLIGVPLGILASYFKGVIGFTVMRIVDIGLSIPEFILMLALASFFKPSIWNLVIAITIVRWMTYTRLTRTLTNQILERPYIKLAKMYRVPVVKIWFKHVLPQLMPSIIVLMTVDFGKIILYISSLSFLGLGATPPSPEWGAMLESGRDYMLSDPLLLIVPAVFIMTTILLFNLAGDRLRDIVSNEKGES